MDGGDFVPRHFDFGDDLHVVAGGKGDEVPHFLLGVVARNLQRHVVHPHPAASLFGEQGIGFYLYAPGLIVYEMEVKGIEFVASHLDNEGPQVIEGDKYAGRVDHQFAQGGAWLVRDDEGGKGAAACFGVGCVEQLA